MPNPQARGPLEHTPAHTTQRHHRRHGPELRPCTFAPIPLFYPIFSNVQPVFSVRTLHPTFCRPYQNSNNPTVNAYDILAVQPTTEKLFQAACSTFEVDIISLDFSTRMPFYLKHTQVGQAIERGIYFEICYSAGIRGELMLDVGY
ncbi:RNase P subunit p30-domain-containing protein [Jimgerdemannia flammicorona]|uniref:RNase P subunit p30-domain-containing protein n=1 Tax=Jimgerdemannia flammicorona TaxID=994334 RepID=A0A433Q265_9FUNG|nr:RNase P subunit p30-domain-containing protein [Jimgerdemannia flammicorona]